MAVKLTPAGIARDLAERVGWTFFQNFVLVLVLLGQAGLHHHQAWVKAAATGGWASLFALATAGLALLVGWHPGGYAAVFDRAARTFLQTFLAVMALSSFSSFTDAGAADAIAAACATAFFAAIKSVAGLANPNTVGDSTAVPVAALK